MKIGFIAMSGIRACDPDLLALSWTADGPSRGFRVSAC